MIIEEIAKDTGIDPVYLYKLSRTASHRYKTFTIPKRSDGVREIQQPSAEIKFVQRWLITSVFSQLPIHDAATAYREGVGIADNARRHVRSKFILKLDFVDFFPSITRSDIIRLLNRNRQLIPTPLSRRDLQHIGNFVCRNDALCIGAPSSPILSNAVMWNFDDFWSRRANESGVNYSRYSDDICFSSDRRGILARFFDEMKRYLETSRWPNLQINNEKTVFSSKRRRRIVTGLVLSSEGKISIGRSKKRWIRGLVYRYKKGELSSYELSYLRGYLAHVHAVETTFLTSLRKKFGYRTIKKVLNEDVVMRKPNY